LQRSMHEKDDLLQGGPGRSAEPFVKAIGFFQIYNQRYRKTYLLVYFHNLIQDVNLRHFCALDVMNRYLIALGS
jgi:hypothetical protein